LNDGTAMASNTLATLMVTISSMRVKPDIRRVPRRLADEMSSMTCSAGLGIYLSVV
jgi:hypothetical protein